MYCLEILLDFFPICLSWVYTSVCDIYYLKNNTLFKGIVYDIKCFSDIGVLFLF